MTVDLPGKRALLLLLIPILALTLFFAPSVTSQDSAASDCAALVETALAVTDNVCSDTGRNQACYGNILLNANPRESVTDFAFNGVGDITDLIQIQSMQLSALNTLNNEWGVALMQIQANLPETLPGQNVTFLVFGDVQIADQTDAAATQSLTVANPVNVRLVAAEDGPLLGSLAAGESVSATGQYTNDLGETWVQIRYEQHIGRTGWIISSALVDDVDTLETVARDSQAYGPMQAFYFQTGIGAAPCTEAPADGILVQTPAGAGAVNFAMNEVSVTMGSTGFFRAVPGQAMQVYGIEGQIRLRSNGVTQVVRPGTVSQIPLSQSGVAAGIPSLPQPYEADAVAALRGPLQMLPDTHPVPPPAPAVVIPAATAIPATDAPPTVNPGDPPQPTAMPLPPCFVERNERARLTFANASELAVEVFEIDDFCTEVRIAALDAGEAFQTRAFVGVTYVVRDSENGNQLLSYTPVDESAVTLTITE